ncbi:MAG: hypothetical protein V7K67_16630 [Nostoc sp.]
MGNGGEMEAGEEFCLRKQCQPPLLIRAGEAGDWEIGRTIYNAQCPMPNAQCPN